MPRADPAQHHREEKYPAGHGHEAAEAHDAEAEVFAERTYVLLGTVLFAPEPVGAGQRESEAEDRLATTEEQELQTRATRCFGRGTVRRDSGAEIIGRRHQRDRHRADGTVVVARHERARTADQRHTWRVAAPSTTSTTGKIVQRMR